MSDKNVCLEHSLLQSVTNPAQYVGGEFNSVKKDHDKVDVTFALGYSDTYSVGMSNLGLKILYDIINKREDALAERFFAPWVDMEEKMREKNIPLFSLETRRKIKHFDVIGFNLQYEMIYSNILNMLDLADLPVLASEREDLTFPLVIGGGPCAYNPEPLADFFDAFVIGDGEEAIVEIIEVIKEFKQNNNITKVELLKELSNRVSGFYAPRFYKVEYREDGVIDSITADEGVPEKVTRAMVESLDEASYPTKFLIPNTETVHDRLPVEIMRGCVNGCRFCQAGMIYRPNRIRKVKTIMDICRQGYKETGFEEIGLSSLSSGNYPDLRRLLRKVSDEFTPNRVNISLPSLRVNEALTCIPGAISSVRKSGLTIAPEAASERLRNSINKPITNEALFAGVKSAYEAGWQLVKLYFMIGLPGETEEDIEEIDKIAYNTSLLRKEVCDKFANVNLAVSSFVPKPHTPFQWSPMVSRDYIEKTQSMLKKLVRSRFIKLKLHDINQSLLEGVFSRGDRRLGKVILEAWKQGAKFDAWSEHFKPDLWFKVLQDLGLDPDFYMTRERKTTEILPWDHINIGVSKEFMISEYEKSHDNLSTPSCVESQKCQNCGVQKILKKSCLELDKE